MPTPMVDMRESEFAPDKAAAQQAKIRSVQQARADRDLDEKARRWREGDISVGVAPHPPTYVQSIPPTGVPQGRMTVAGTVAFRPTPRPNAAFMGSTATWNPHDATFGTAVPNL